MNALVALLVRVVRVKEGERESDSDARGGESRICRNSRSHPPGKTLHDNLHWAEGSLIEICPRPNFAAPVFIWTLCNHEQPIFQILLFLNDSQ